MKHVFAAIVLVFLSVSSVFAAEQSDFTFYRNPQSPITGTADGAAFYFPGNALTASAWRLRGDLVTRPIRSATWVIVWNPNTTSGYTAVRLVKGDNGPTNIVELARVSSNNYTAPKVDSVDVTAAFSDIVTRKQYKQIMQQTAGNGANGALIYASWIEIVWGDAAP